MIKYILRRLIQSVPTLFGISILSYMLMVAAPGGPVATLTFGPRTTPEQKAQLAVRLGVADPWPIQYLRWLLGDDWMRWDSDGDGIAENSILISNDADGDGEPDLPPGDRYGILRGDFGRSFFQNQPVLRLVVDRIPATLELGIASLIIGLIIGIPIGILAAVWKGGIFDNFTRVTAVVFNAVPVFWLGLVLILLVGKYIPEAVSGVAKGDGPFAQFAQTLPGADGKPVLPMGNRCSGSILTGGCPPIHQRLEYLLLPTFVLATGGIAGFSRFMRASMLDVVNQDYIRTARAKGLSGREVWFKHGARNALIPIATFLGPALTGLLGGAAITETIFSWPGLGRLAVNSVQQQDYPVVMATTLFAAVATILGFILSDIMYALIDPRIRFS